VHRQPGQLLQRLKDRAVVADQLVQGRADHGHDRAFAFDVHIDVAVQVRDVQQAFHVVRGDVALELEVAQPGAGVLEIFRVAGLFGVLERVGRVVNLDVLLAQDRTSHCALRCRHRLLPDRLPLAWRTGCCRTTLTVGTSGSGTGSCFCLPSRSPRFSRPLATGA
jgi:hypothetical protein